MKAILLFVFALLALVAASANPKIHLLLFADSAYTSVDPNSYDPIVGAFLSKSKGKLNTVILSQEATTDGIESSLAALKAADVNNSYYKQSCDEGEVEPCADLVFLAAHGSACSVLDAFANVGTATFRVDGYVFLGCFPSTIGAVGSAPRLVLAGELDGVNTVDKIVPLHQARQAFAGTAEFTRRGAFVLVGVTNAHFASGSKILANDVHPSFALSASEARNAISSVVTAFCDHNLLQPIKQITDYISQTGMTEPPHFKRGFLGD